MANHETLMEAACRAEELCSLDELEEAAEAYSRCPHCRGHGDSQGLFGNVHKFACRICKRAFERHL